MEADNEAEPAPVVGPLALDNWHAFENLFGLERGGISGCWCMWPPHLIRVALDIVSAWTEIGMGLAMSRFCSEQAQTV
jgi:hypothetical protein